MNNKAGPTSCLDSSIRDGGGFLREVGLCTDVRVGKSQIELDWGWLEDRRCAARNPLRRDNHLCSGSD
jgi:hypothetical protein